MGKNCPEFKNNDIIECRYNTETECFEPIKIRTDKSHANNLYTVDKTMQNIRENITLEELFNMRSKFK